jgi:hypothetical protein
MAVSRYHVQLCVKYVVLKSSEGKEADYLHICSTIAAHRR